MAIGHSRALQEQHLDRGLALAEEYEQRSTACFTSNLLLDQPGQPIAAETLDITAARSMPSKIVKTTNLFGPAARRASASLRAAHRASVRDKT
jgi:hypothetical protein